MLIFFRLRFHFHRPFMDWYPVDIKLIDILSIEIAKFNCQSLKYIACLHFIQIFGWLIYSTCPNYEIIFDRVFYRIREACAFYSISRASENDLAHTIPIRLKSMKNINNQVSSDVLSKCLKAANNAIARRIGTARKLQKLQARNS